MTPPTPRLHAWLPRVLAVAVVAGSLANIGWQSWQLRDEFQLPAIPRLQAPDAVATPGTLGNLFAAAPSTTQASLPAIDGMQLQASLVADVASQSRALILVPGSGTLHVQVGDMLHEDLLLESVSAEQVSLRQGSTLHILELNPMDPLAPAGDTPQP